MKRLLLITSLIPLMLLGFGSNAISDEIATQQENSSFQIYETLGAAMALMQGDNIHRPKAVSNEMAKLEALKGSWYLTHQDTDLMSHTDKLVLLNVEASTTLNMISGVITFSGGMSSSFVSCFVPDSGSAANYDYECVTSQGVALTNLSTYRIYGFNVSANSVTTGAYGTGFDLTTSINSLISKKYPVTGYRDPPVVVTPPVVTPPVVTPPTPPVTTPVVTPPATTTPPPVTTPVVTPPTTTTNPFDGVTPPVVENVEYNPVTQILSIPRAKVDIKYFQVKLKYIGDSLFKIDDLQEVK